MQQSITNISVDVLKVHPRNTEFFDDISGEEYERFKKSIEDDGLLSPLIVAPDMTVISGHQRLKACKELGFKSVPVIIKDDLEDEDEKLKKLIAANFGRSKNDPIKQSKLIDEYVKLQGICRGNNQHSKCDNRTSSLEQVAKDFGISVRQLHDIRKLASLPQEIQDLISEGTINATTGFKVIARLSEEEQLALLSKLPTAQKFTQAQVQQYIDQIKGKDKQIADLQAEAAEAVRAIKAGSDSEEYIRAKKAKEDLEGECRKEYEARKALETKVGDKDKQIAMLREQFNNATKKLNELQRLKEVMSEPEVREVEVEVEVYPVGYEEDMAELEEFRSQKRSQEGTRTISFAKTPEEDSESYYNFTQMTMGDFLARMENIVLRKKVCHTLSDERQARILEMAQIIINKSTDIMDEIKKDTKEVAA